MMIWRCVVPRSADCQSGRSGDDWVDVVAHRQCGRGSSQQTRFFSVVETAGISRPSIWEPHTARAQEFVLGRLRIRRTCGNVRSGFRHHDGFCARTTEQDSHVLHATREDHDETPPFPFGFFNDEGDELAEERVWQLFARVPRMLMHRVHGTGSVGRDELGASGEFSVRSRWWELLASGRNSISIGTQKRQFARSEEGTKRHGNPGAHAEGPGLTIQAGNGSPKTRRFQGIP